MQRSAHVLGLVLACALVAFASGRAMSPALERPRPTPQSDRSDVAALEVPAHIDAIIVGGGPSPELDQVSLEDDVALAGRVLGSRSVVLFAGGPGTNAVQERTLDVDGDPMVFGLANLFAPRGGRDAHYRATQLALHGAATLDEIFAAFDLALPDGDRPLLFYFTGHGRGGEEPGDSIAETWGGAAFDARSLAEALEDSHTARRVRLIVTSCYAGGFAELAFQGGDPTLGVTNQDRCGLFSTAWDRESGGCDSDPDRGTHEGFGVHFLSALAGHDRDGGDASAQIDLDHDGVITLAEAMARVRIASRAIDVPITTSERLLRVIAPAEGEGTIDLPEQRAVVDALLRSLALHTVEEAAEALGVLEARREETDDALGEAYADAQDLGADAASDALSRWPVLDDPYHPDYAATLARDHDAIAAFLDGERVTAWAEAEDDAAALQLTNDGLEVQIAVHLRIVQAAETIALAGRLAAHGGADWEAYTRMRACEASAP